MSGEGKKEWEQIRDFFRDYVDPNFKNTVGTIRLSKANTRAHNLRVCECCLTLIEKGIPFYTEVRLKNGTRPDIVAPTHIKPIIEVLQTETIEKFNEKKAPKYPEELLGEIIFVDANKPYEEKMIL